MSSLEPLDKETQSYRIVGVVTIDLFAHPVPTPPSTVRSPMH
jgi:hypothetical protein